MLEFVLIVYFLLDWLGFWAEVHLVQEEIDLFQKQNFYKFEIFGLIVYFLLDWLNFWAEVHLVQEETDLSQKTELLKI